MPWVLATPRIDELGDSMRVQGVASAEAPMGARLHELLSQQGWTHGERCTPLGRDLAQPVEDPGVSIEVVGYDARGNAVAAATVWSAGPTRPGLLEPLGVHHDYRGHGYGKAISIAAAAALHQLGSSSALVCTPSSNAAVATYRSAGFRLLPEIRDRCRLLE